MERKSDGSLPVGRGRAKSKAPPPIDVFALGSRSSVAGGKPSSFATALDPKPVLKTVPTSQMHGSTLSSKNAKPSTFSPYQGVKRPYPAPVRPRMSSSNERDVSSVVSISLLSASESPNVSHSSSDLVGSVMAFIARGDRASAEKSIYGAISQIRPMRFKTDPLIVVSLMYLVKVEPRLFTSGHIVNLLLSFTKRETNPTPKSKSSCNIHCLVFNLIFSAFKSERHWPETIARAFIEDSLGDRVWVENVLCAELVLQMVSAFNTQLPNRQLLNKLEITKPGANLGEDEELAIFSLNMGPVTESRYSSPFSKASLWKLSIDAANDHLSKKVSSFTESGMRSLVMYLVSTCGLPEIRQIASSRLDAWFQNARLSRQAQLLLLTVCLNCNPDSPSDLETIASIIKIRLRTKSLVSLLVGCISELASARPNNISALAKLIIYNELNTQRSPCNIPCLVALFQDHRRTMSFVVAAVAAEMIHLKDEYCRALRLLLRELFRANRGDVDHYCFVEGFFSEFLEHVMEPGDPPTVDRRVTASVDLVCSMLAFSAATAGRESLSLPEFSACHCRAIELFSQGCFLWAVSEDVMAMLLRKLLWLEPIETYFIKEGWPSDQERVETFRLLQDTPTSEATIRAILSFGPAFRKLGCCKALMEIVLVYLQSLVPRLPHTKISISSVDIIQLFLDVSRYEFPPALASGHVEAVFERTLFWLSQLVLLVLAVLSPAVLGLYLWFDCPTTSMLLRMLVTDQYEFPCYDDEHSSLQARTQATQAASIERDYLMSLQQYLVETGYVEFSGLIDKLTIALLNGPVRMPPQDVLVKLKSLNEDLHLGSWLCSYRDPDFLTDVLQKQTSQLQRPWLAKLLKSPMIEIAGLPAACLVEYLFVEYSCVMCPNFFSGVDVGSAAYVTAFKIIGRLHAYLSSDCLDNSIIRVILTFLLSKMLSQSDLDRERGYNILSLLLGWSAVLSRRCTSVQNSPLSLQLFGSSMAEDCFLTLYSYPVRVCVSSPFSFLSSLPTQGTILELFHQFIQGCLYVETDHIRICEYMKFLHDHHASLEQTQKYTVQLSLYRMLVARYHLVLSIAGSDLGREFCLAVLNILSSPFALEDYGIHAESGGDLLRLEWSEMMQLSIPSIVLSGSLFALGISSGFVPAVDTVLYQRWFCAGSGPKRVDDGLPLGDLLPEWLLVVLLSSAEPHLSRGIAARLSFASLVTVLQCHGLSDHGQGVVLSQLEQSMEPSLVVGISNKHELWVHLKHLRRRGGPFLSELSSCFASMPTCRRSHAHVLEPFHRQRDDFPAEGVGELTLVPSLQDPYVWTENCLLIARCPGKMPLYTRFLLLAPGHQFPQEFRDNLFQYFANHVLKPGSQHDVLQAPVLACFLRFMLFLIGGPEQVGCPPSHRQRLWSSVVARLRLSPPCKHPVPENGPTAFLSHLRTVVDSLGVTKAGPSEMETLPVTELLKEHLAFVKFARCNCRVWCSAQYQFYKEMLIQLTRSDITDDDTISSRGIITDEICRLIPGILPCNIFTKDSPVSRHGLRLPLRHLLANLIHESSYNCLERFIGTLADGQTVIPDLTGAVVILEIIQVLLNHPKLTQGQDIKSNRGAARLLPRPLVIDFRLLAVILQANILAMGCAQTETVSLAASLLKELSQISEGDMLLASYHEANRCLQSNGSHSGRLHVLWYLYNCFPRLFLSEVSLFQNALLPIAREGLKHDRQALLFHITRLLAMSAHVPDSPLDVSESAFFLLAGVTMEHPLLATNCWPVLVTALLGRQSMTRADFDQSRQLRIVSFVLTLLSLSSSQANSLPDGGLASGAVDQFVGLCVELMSSRCLLEAEQIALARKIVTLLGGLARHSADLAGRLLREHQHMLAAHLRPGAGCLVRTCTDPAGGGGTNALVSSPNIVLLFLKEALPDSQVDTDAFVLKSKLTSPSCQELSRGLAELDTESQRSPELIKHLLFHVGQLLRSENSNIRQSAHRLLHRYIYACPQGSSAVWPFYRSMLESGSLELMEEALRFLVEMPLIAREEVLPTLRRTFYQLASGELTASEPFMTILVGLSLDCI